MGKVKSALEIALERAGKLGEFSAEEKERMKEEERSASVLREFYQEKIDVNELWKRFKGSTVVCLSGAQISLLDTLGLAMLEEEFKRRREALLALETLKERPNTASIEPGLDGIAELQKEYQEMREKAIEDLRRQLEVNPQLRMVPVRSPDGKSVMQMAVTVDEAVKARMSEYLSEHEEQFNQEFTFLLQELKGLVQPG